MLIPFEGSVEVMTKRGELIKPGSMLFTKSSKRILGSTYIPKELGVKVEGAQDYVVRLNGEYVLKGEILAERMSGGGLAMKRLYASSDGILSTTRIEKGFLDVLSESENDEYTAQYHGKVLDVDLSNGMSVETMVWFMPMLTDNYHERPNEYKNVRVGEFEVLGEGNSMYVVKDLKDNYKGKIVYAGRFAYPDLLREIYERGAEYIIVYSMDYEDFATLNFSVGIIGGFGNIPYPKEYVSICKSLTNSFVSVDLEKNIVIWPDQGTYLHKAPHEYPSGFISFLKPGMNVRVMDVDNFRAIGKVLDLNEEENMVSIELEDGKRYFISQDLLTPVHI